MFPILGRCIGGGKAGGTEYAGHGCISGNVACMLTA